MASQEKAAEKKKELSSQISSIVRTLSISVLAVDWLFISGGKDAPPLASHISLFNLLIVAILCLLAIIFDFLQYTFAYMQVSRDYEAARSNVNHDVTFKKSRIREFSFRVKQVFALTGAVWLVISIGFALVEIRSSSASSDAARSSIQRKSISCPSSSRIEIHMRSSD